MFIDFRCKVVGSDVDLTHHLAADCKYEPLKDFLKSVCDKCKKQSEALKARDEEIHYLKSMVFKLSTRLEKLEATVGKTLSDADKKQLALN